MKLHLGVVDIPYRANGPIKSGKKKPRFNAGATTTGFVAQILEDKYSVMQNFADLHMNDIAELLTIGMAESVESLMQGAPPSLKPFGQPESEIGQLFRTYLDQSEIRQTGQPGVPTEAALKGVNHRLKNKRGPVRPDFIDTGLYQASFRAWID